MTDMLAGIKVKNLPLTFREAIQIVRKMDIKYLWIDSLCIIQKDRADWLAESILMEKVYSNALCNIAATASVDGSQGLFRERDPLLLHRVQFEATFAAIFGNGEAGMQSFTSLIGNYWEHELDKAPLNRRAWVLQERLLARRVLHYNTKELMWECREHTASETYPKGFPTQLGSVFFKDLNPHSTRTSATHMDIRRGQSEGAYALWSNIQTFYSTCKLTKAEDKLIALSGIAKKFQTLTGDTYVAGMWLKLLARQILWDSGKVFQHRASEEPTREDRSVYRAPSFSWASVDRPTDISNASDPGLLISVDHVVVEGVNGDTTGMLKTASLDLHGTLKLVEFRRRDLRGDKYMWKTYIGGVRVRQHWRDPHVLLDQSGRDLALLCAARRLFYMPARRYTVKSNANEHLACLLLELLELETITFRRIGLLTAWISDMLPPLLATQADECLLPCTTYDPKAERPHTLLLV